MNKRISRREFMGAAVAVGAMAAGSEGLGALAGTRADKRVVVWSEGTAPKKVYPNDVNTAIAEGLAPLADKGWKIQTANINEADQGLPDSLLNDTAVLIWWGHQKHGDVKDELVQRIVRRVKEDGMGFIATHSAHYSKALKALLGTNCGWKGGYVEDGSEVQVLVKAPKHPIARGIKDFVIPHTERYSEAFEAPEPETLVFDGIYTLPNSSKENSRQGLVWTIGKGRVFYFQPGHESYPIYFQDEVRKVFQNGVRWVGR